MLTVVLSSIVIAAVTSWGLVRALIPQLSRRLLDQPNARSSHRQPTPRGGGVAFVLVAATASLLAVSSRSSVATAEQPQIVLSLIALPLALVGFLDDRHNLPASWRFGAQLATALALILLSPLPCPWLAALPLLVAITGHDQAEEPGRTARAGFDHYLVKPVDPSVLLDLLARV